jgi:hypothetical protein
MIANILMLINYHFFSIRLGCFLGVGFLRDSLEGIRVIFNFYEFYF